MATIGLLAPGHWKPNARLAVAHWYDVVSAIHAGRRPWPLSWPSSSESRDAPHWTRQTRGHRRGGDSVENYQGGARRASRRQDCDRHRQLYPQRDGHITQLDNESTTTAELLQAHLPASKVVTGLTYYAAHLTTDGRPSGTKDRRALVIAGNDPAAKGT